MLLTRGREESAYEKSKSVKKSINKAILAGKQKFQLYDGNAAVLPPGVRPVCKEIVVPPLQDPVPVQHKGRGTKAFVSAVGEDFSRDEEQLYLAKYVAGAV